MLKQLIIIFTLLYALCLAHAEDFPRDNTYQTRTYDTLERIAEKFFSRHQKQYGKKHIEEYINDLKHWNPHVANWKEIPVDTEIYVDYPYPPFPAPTLSFTYKAPHKAPAEEFSEADNFAELRDPPDDHTLKLYGMLTLSQGNFNDRLTSNTGNIASQQNSPLTLGLGSNYLLDGYEQLLSASAYWSFLSLSQVTGDTALAPASSSVPNEIGANLYFQRHDKEFDFSMYAGFDYEKFSSFNTSAYVLGLENLAICSNTIYLATVGVGKNFYFGNYTLATKVGLSSTIHSTTTSYSNSNFQGQRFLLFASFHGDSKFSYNFLYKRHSLKGQTNLTIDRVGLGISYELF